MALNPEIVLIALSPAMTGAVLGWFSLRRNGKNGRPVDPTLNPHGTKLGDAPAAWWIDQENERARDHAKHSERLAARYDSTGLAIVKELKELRELTEAHFKLHH